MSRIDRRMAEVSSETELTENPQNKHPHRKKQQKGVNSVKGQRKNLIFE